jgi:hypothetical protein
MPMASRTFVEPLRMGTVDALAGPRCGGNFAARSRDGIAPDALTIRSKSVYHPPAIRARSQGHPSVIGQVALLLKG